MQMKLRRDMPPASPSRPSERLMALVTPTMAISVNGIANQSGRKTLSGRSIPRHLIFTPPYRITTKAAAH